MDYADYPRIGLVDVIKLTIEDIKGKDFELDLRHLSPWERAECARYIEYKS